MRPLKNIISLLLIVAAFGFGAKNVHADNSPSILYVPLIGITSVPDPLALPEGPGNVTYHYAVKNFLQEVALTDVRVIDDHCGSVTFVEGDDDHDSQLDYSETWRYGCTTTLTQTTQSIATATGTVQGILASDDAFATVIVGSNTPPPLVSIVNITKVAYPLSLPKEGGDITFTYRINNPGVIPLGGVSVTDDKCSAMSGKLGDTNGNGLLDTHEVWVYTCTTHLTQTTTNTAKVTAYANGLRAVDTFSLTVKVDGSLAQSSAQSSTESSVQFPDTGTVSTLKFSIWGILLGILITRLLFLALARKSKRKKGKKAPKSLTKWILLALFLVVGAGAEFAILFQNQTHKNAPVLIAADTLFGWKYPVADFPSTGSLRTLSYSDIRDPGGVPQGLPVRLRIPIIGVDSAIEDALITPDGRMDVPAGSKNVAWFALGPHPGQEGSAVIGGHYGISGGVPFVFYNLDKLKIGDKVSVLDDGGNTLSFVVRSVRLFDRNADATPVFTSSDGLAHLNLITCEGIWNQVNGTYPKRRVVFTDAVATENSTSVTPLLPSTAVSTSVAIPAPSVTSPPVPIPAPSPSPISAPPPTINTTETETPTTPILPREIPLSVSAPPARSFSISPGDVLVSAFLLLSIALAPLIVSLL